MNINWDEAPEGATHYDTGFHLFCNENGFWGQSSLWVPDNEQHEWGTIRYIQRPASWNGEGLPPVGSRVEFYSDDFDNEDYWSKYLTNESEVEIIAHIASNVSQSEEDLAVFVFEYSSGHRQVEQAMSCCFRPIKTKEQLAEEREKVVEEMLRIFATGVWDGGASSGCKALYDHGYRKQENNDAKA